MNDLEASFNDFHAENPRVYELFCHFTDMLLKRGWKHHSADAVLHRIRWSADVETTGDPHFKIRNAHSAYYARLWTREHPEHQGFFRLCKVRE